jgi:hypothetical protein
MASMETVFYQMALAQFFSQSQQDEMILEYYE